MKYILKKYGFQGKHGVYYREFNGIWLEYNLFSKELYLYDGHKSVLIPKPCTNETEFRRVMDWLLQKPPKSEEFLFILFGFVLGFIVFYIIYSPYLNNI